MEIKDALNLVKETEELRQDIATLGLQLRKVATMHLSFEDDISGEVKDDVRKAIESVLKSHLQQKKLKLEALCQKY